LLHTMHVFVLPTWYREGVPHATLEALSVGRAIITTDSVGARETVKLTEQGAIQREHGESVMEGTNGFLIHPRDVDALVTAMQRVLSEPARVPAFGRASRQLAEDVFDVRHVNSVILRAMQLTGNPVTVQSPMISAPVTA
ncbi:MAG: glycosyltransferase, partial [Verrucomicrobiaceae bacterium]